MRKRDEINAEDGERNQRNTDQELQGDKMASFKKMYCRRSLILLCKID